ncbi:MAG: hypothetical protein ACRD2M_10925, partial [Terriglobales bacterium]
MQKARVFVVAMCLAALGLAVPMLAQGPSGPVVRVATWKVRTGMNAQFEAGLKKHNQFHRVKNDRTELETWQISSG